MQANYLGIEIGGTKLQIVAGDAHGHIRERHRFTVDRQEGAAGIRRQIAAALPDLLQRHQPAAIGVGFGGPVDWESGRIARSHQIEGWSDFELRAWLQGMTQIPVLVENDANLGALGEAVCGAGVGANPVFFMTIGSGVGGGLVADGRIYHGAKPGEAEIGYLRLERQGTTVESRCSGWAVDAKIRRLKESGSDSLLCRLIGQTSGGEAKHLAQALQEGDPAARLILEETAQDLAFGLSHVVQLFHPQVIVLGGGLALLGEPLRAAVAKALPAYVMEVFQPGPAVRVAALGEDAIPAGCLAAAGRLAGDAERQRNN